MTTRQDRAERAGEDREQDRLDEMLRAEVGLMEAVVADGVMSTLGRPPGFLRASARQVRAGRYRVNVFTGLHAGDARVAHSFFVEADGGGRVLASSPPVTGVYPAATRG